MNATDPIATISQISERLGRPRHLVDRAAARSGAAPLAKVGSTRVYNAAGVALILAELDRTDAKRRTAATAAPAAPAGR